MYLTFACGVCRSWIAIKIVTSSFVHHQSSEYILHWKVHTLVSLREQKGSFSTGNLAMLC